MQASDILKILQGIEFKVSKSEESVLDDASEEVVTDDASVEEAVEIISSDKIEEEDKFSFDEDSQCIMVNHSIWFDVANSDLCFLPL